MSKRARAKTKAEPLPIKVGALVKVVRGPIRDNERNYDKRHGITKGLQGLVTGLHFRDEADDADTTWFVMFAPGLMDDGCKNEYPRMYTYQLKVVGYADETK